MRLDTRPLLDTEPDAELFVNRENEMARLLHAAASDLNVLVVGERGMGKTSLLRQAAYRLDQRAEPVVLIDARLADSMEGVLLMIEEALGQAPRTTEVFQTGLQRALNPTRAPRSEALALVRRLAHATPSILMVDNLPSPAVGHELFGRLRDEIWQLPHTWVVTADHADLKTLLAPPADAFFAVRVRLDALQPTAAEALLQRRLDGGQEVMASELARSGEGNPRKLLELARRVVIDGRPDAAYRALERRVSAETSASELGRPHGMLFAELLAMGSASPSDKELLERMGWSRPRANQVLRELEAAGLAIARDEVAHGAGKPRRVYEPALGGEVL